MKFRMWTKDVGQPDDKARSEDYDRRCTDPHKEAQALIDYFNSTLYPGEKARELVRVEGGAGEATMRHDWEKTNLVTVVTRSGSHDAYRCVDCGVTGKRYELGGLVALDSRYKKRAVCPGPAVKPLASLVRRLRKVVEWVRRMRITEGQRHG